MPSLLKEERQQLIQDAVQARRQVTVAQLSSRFDVSDVTIRRDLREMAEQGVLRRAHGGAVAVTPASIEPPVVHRMTQMEMCKKSIGQVAATLVPDGSSVFIGSGSTTAHVARHLVDHKDLTVITNAINIASALVAADDVTVVVTGGMMRNSELSLIGHIAEQSLREVRVDQVIMGIPAISLEAGLTSGYLPEVMTDRAIIEMASQLIIVADHTKFDKITSAYVAPVERITTLVTDSKAASGIITHLEKMGITVVVANIDEKGD